MKKSNKWEKENAKLQKWSKKYKWDFKNRKKIKK